MEVFNHTSAKIANYRSVINQSGSGSDMDRYIYSNQDGEGIGQFFGNLVSTAIPLLKGAIKGAARIAAPHIKRAASDIITTGSKRAIDKLSSNIVHKTHSPKRKKQQKKWRNL